MVWMSATDRSHGWDWLQLSHQCLCRWVDRGHSTHWADAKPGTGSAAWSHPAFFGSCGKPSNDFPMGNSCFFPLYDFCWYHPFLVKVGFTTTAAFLTEDLLISLQDVAAMQTLRHCHVIVKWNWQWETVNIGVVCLASPDNHLHERVFNSHRITGASAGRHHLQCCNRSLRWGTWLGNAINGWFSSKPCWVTRG